MSDLRLMKNFVAVFRNGSFRGAANEMGITQSSVTKRIQLLESHLGMRLFNRTTRAVDPTDTARALIPYAESALRSADAFQQEARLLAGGDIGGIRVGSIALAAETVIVGGLARLAQTHPNLDVEVLVGGSDIYRDLATGDCDVAVGDRANFEMSPYAASLRMERVHDDQLVFVYRRKHPARRAATLSELLHFPLAIPSRYFNENRLFEAMAAQTDPPATPRYRLNSLSACLSLAATSDVVTLAPRSMVGRPAPGGRRPAIEIAEFETGIDYSMVLVTLARNTPTPAVRAFAEAIAAAQLS